MFVNTAFDLNYTNKNKTHIEMIKLYNCIIILYIIMHIAHAFIANITRISCGL